MESNRKREQDHDADGAAVLSTKTPQQKGMQIQKNKMIIDLEVLKNKWSPGRVDRIEKGILKINTDDPSLCGGDWISNIGGRSVTLSFVFWKDGKYFGLTVAHIFESLGDKVYSFFKKDEVPLPEGNPLVGGDKENEDEFDPNPEKNESESLAIYEIGKVVSLSRSTDSVIFEFLDDIEMKPPLTVKVASDVTRVIQLPEIESEVLGPPPPTVGKSLVGFGARRRGFHAIVAIPSTNQKDNLATVPQGSICITSKENNKERITYDGDCGTIFMDLECNAAYFHHDGTKSEPWKSFGTPLWNIMRKHSQLGGTSEDPEKNGPHKDENAKESLDGILVAIRAVKFNVHVVPPPPRTLSGGDLKVPKHRLKIVPNPSRKKKRVHVA